MIIVLEQNINTPAWAQGLFIAIAIIIFYAIKSVFSKKNPSVEINERENAVFSNKISGRDKVGWVERIDYWIEEKNYDEAVKLCNYYTSFFGFDDDINPRIKRVNDLIINS